MLQKQKDKCDHVELFFALNFDQTVFEDDRMTNNNSTEKRADTDTANMYTRK